MIILATQQQNEETSSLSLNLMEKIHSTSKLFFSFLNQYNACINDCFFFLDDQTTL